MVLSMDLVFLCVDVAKVIMLMWLHFIVQVSWGCGFQGLERVICGSVEFWKCFVVKWRLIGSFARTHFSTPCLTWFTVLIVFF